MVFEAARTALTDQPFVADKVSVDALRTSYQTNEWDEKKSLSWIHLCDVLIPSLQLFKDDDEDGAESQVASDLLELMEVIYARQQANEFPVVRPSDLQNVEEQNAAEQSLSLLEKIEHVQISMLYF